MPDSRASYETPRGWGEAFAALPMEAPPADAWTSIARRLPQPQPDARRRRRPYWLAMAAAIALAMVIPVFQWIERENPETLPASSSVATAPVAPAPSSNSSAGSVESTIVADESQPVAMLPMPDSTSPSLPTTATATATAPRIDTSAKTGESLPASPSDPAAEAAAMAEQHRQLENLYAESARLEAVLAQLQEPRVASATAATLSAELQDHIADIDGALSQPDVPSTSQLDLWQQRVDALRQLTGVETTQRWMAAQGTATDGPLAHVY